AHPDRVPTTRRARFTSRTSARSARTDPHRLAARSDRSRQHARCVHRPDPPQARCIPQPADDQNAARRRLPVAIGVIRSITSGLRGRLVMSVLGAIALTLAGLTVAFDLVLADRLNSDAKGVVEARAAAELASLRVSRDRILVSEAPDDLSPDIQIWVFDRTRAIEHPRSATPAMTAAAAALARRAPALRDVPGTSTRLYSLPVVKFGRRLG